MAETAELQVQRLRRRGRANRIAEAGISGDKMTAMRQVQEMTVEFVNALNAAAAAESECAKLRRLLEEERKLVQRLKQENEDEAQMAKRKIEKMSHLLAEARKDVEYATTRADFAEVKRELQEARELVQLLEPASEETGQGILRQVDDKELELDNTIDAASIAESECDKLMIMLEEVRKLVQRLILEKDDEAQLTKRQIEEIGHELADTQKYAEYATARADEAESECAKLERMLVEEGKTVQRLMLEKNDEAELAKRQIEKISQELAYARKDGDIAKNEWIKLKGKLKEKEQFIIDLKLQILEIRQITMRQVEDITRELEDAQKEAEYARYDADIAKNERIQAKKELQEKLELVQLLKLECQETRESAVRQVEQKELELAYALDSATVALSSSAVAKTCEECGMMLTICPICRVEITHRIKLFSG